MNLPHNEPTEDLIMDILRAHPDEWMTSNDIAEMLNGTPSGIAGHLRVLAGTNAHVEISIDSRRKRFYRYTEVLT